MNHRIHFRKIFSIGLMLSLSAMFSATAQTEVMAWGNITGIRVEGQLMEFETSLRVVGRNWENIVATGKEKQARPSYHRDGDIQTVETAFAGFLFTERVIEKGPGSAEVSIITKSERDTAAAGVFFCIRLPGKYYSDGTIRLGSSGNRQKLSDLVSDKEKIRRLSTRIISVESPEQQLSVSFSSTSPVVITRDDESTGYLVYIGMTGQNIRKNQQIQRTFTINTRGTIDRTPVIIDVDAENPGRRFDGFGGNFRLQNPKADPAVIGYCLDNMRVAWGRVEMPWSMWHPDENSDPASDAKAGKLNRHVHESMLMAQRLAEKGMPVILSDWSAPAWAILGDPADAFRFRSKGIYGYPLNPAKTEQIYKSLADYIVYMKQNYGVEPDMFSFNESDLGINVRHTGKEHADFIKGFGAYMASRGLATRLLLGDNSDATTFDFIVPAMDDPETHKYIGAVSFHSWRGCDDETLEKWAGAARKMNLPLIVAEGSTDAAAWTYPEIFYEQTFALYEINLYIRICSICQPLSILQWQLTSDYSVLRGEGIYGTEGPLQPTRRFWNLKQLASTPEGAFSLPVKSSGEEINVAAFGNLARGEYAVHMVNNGAGRPAEIRGIPADVSSVEVFVTDYEKNMENTGTIKAAGGSFKITLPPAAMITIIGRK